jgi:hypothetical protein
VTINRPEKEVAPDGRMAEPSGLKDTQDRISGEDPRQVLRAALRNAKQLVETGEVLRSDQPPTTKQTVTGKPLELVTRHARGESRL